MNWRHRTKKRLIEAFGGQCCICKYDKCPDVFEFHHIDPNEKDFHWGQINGNIRSWDTIVHEIKKCVMLCANCHREVHSSQCDTVLPLNPTRFNNDYTDYNSAKVVYYDQCVVCGNDKKISLQYCSQICAKTKNRKVDWDNINLKDLLDEHTSYEAVGRFLGVSGNAIRRRIKK
jgi:hypothetical protein